MLTAFFFMLNFEMRFKASAVAYLTCMSTDDRDSNKFAIAFRMGSLSTVGGVFHGGRLYQLLDPQISPW